MSQTIRLILVHLLLMAPVMMLAGCDAFEPPKVEPAHVPDASLERLENDVKEKLDSIQKRAMPRDAGSTPDE